MTHFNPAQKFEEIPKFGFALIDSLGNLCEEFNKTSRVEQDKIYPAQFLPKEANSTDTGYDVRYAGPNIDIRPFSYIKLNLGLRVCAPKGWGLKLHPRSSTFTKKFIHAHIGIIDNEFSNVMHFCGQYIPDGELLNAENLTIGFGERIAQIIPEKVQKMIIHQFTNAELDNLHSFKNPTRTGGFGSSGTK